MQPVFAKGQAAFPKMVDNVPMLAATAAVLTINAAKNIFENGSRTLRTPRVPIYAQHLAWNVASWGQL